MCITSNGIGGQWSRKQLSTQRVEQKEIDDCFYTKKNKNDCNKMTFLWLDINRSDDYIHTKIICFLMVVWNSMLLKIIIILLGVEKQHVRFIQPSGLESECISESPPIPLEVMHI
jgi:hypothetical protein